MPAARWKFGDSVAVTPVGWESRRAAGAVLGIGRAASVVLWSGLILFQTTSMYAESMRSDAYIGIVSSLVGMRAIPAVVVTTLLAWPLVRRTTPSVGDSDHDRPTAGAPADAR